MNTIRKAIAQLLTGAVTWATAVTLSEPSAVTSSEWVVALGLGVGAFLVWLVPNEPDVVDLDARLLPYDPEHTTHDRGALDPGAVVDAIRRWTRVNGRMDAGAVAWGTVFLGVIAAVLVLWALGEVPR